MQHLFKNSSLLSQKMFFQIADTYSADFNASIFLLLPGGIGGKFSDISMNTYTWILPCQMS